ncbi:MULTISPECIES: DNA polymerase III subunit beta [Paenibacillus]|uniref:DNA polymerase III subunit beta n=1 Tax=Paenibacillus TaxID=44249 RepID=UPI0022B880B8|nr:DNA polymerase III subunit beta [Paenibacillus caseinilyticus]MCZ8520151.1 DNA polymerase III subunit beta [Paenibacillus caseinilyticus]
MKITIDKSVLLEPLKQLAIGASAKNVSPILSCILLMVKDGDLVLASGDTHFFIRTEIPGIDFELKRPGGIAISAKEIVEVVNRMPSKSIDIEVDGTQAKFMSGKTKMLLQGFDPEEYPELPVHNLNSSFMMPAKEFKELIRRTAFAAYKKEDYSILTGIKAEFGLEGITFWACDRHRMARVTMPIRTSIQLDTVISGEHMKKISSIVNDSEDVTITSDDRMTVIICGRYTMYSWALDGTYPNVTRLLTPAQHTAFTASKSDLIEALERVRITAEKKQNGGFITEMRTDGDEFIIESRNEINEKTEDSIQIGDFKGKGIRFGCDGKYALEALQAIDSDTVNVRLPGPKEFIYFSGADENTALYLVAQIVLREGA